MPRSNNPILRAFFLCLVLAALSFVTPVFAQVSAPTPDTGGAQAQSGGLANPLNATSLPALVTAVLKAVVQVGSVMITLLLVYVGFLFVTAQGNEEKIRSARSALVWTVVGAILLLGAQAISIVIQNTVSSL